MEASGCGLVGWWVERRFLNSCLICPFTVAVDRDKCLFIRSAVRPGQLVKWHALMALTKVERTGPSDTIGYHVESHVHFE